jgi:dolichyl-phosphate-mannose-protein mannosyltransferase
MLSVSSRACVHVLTIPVDPDAEMVNYERPSFLNKFWELQGVMWRTNAGLTDRHAYDSRPHHWPWLRRGIVSHLKPISRLSN